MPIRTVQRVAVVGEGYVGLPLSVRAAEVGYHVVGFDVDQRRVKQLNAGESYVEDIAAHRLAAVLDAGRFRASTEPESLSGFDVCVICVPTPVRHGYPDLSAVEGAARIVAEHVSPGCVIVLESTTYPGTTEDLLRPLLEEISGLRAPGDFHLGYSPERIDPGNGHWNLVNTPKLVSGIDSASLERIDDFYSTIVDQTIPVRNTRTAELAKALENTFRQVNIALINELATVADRLGADVWEAVAAASTKPFGYQPFTPGPGVGGHCLTTDPIYLSWQVERRTGHGLRLVELANELNAGMPLHVVERVVAGLNGRNIAVEASRILLLGLAYKKNSSDLRDSPSLEIARALRERGAHVRAVEPVASAELVPDDICLVSATEEQIASADAVVVLTDHDAFDYGKVERFGRYVFDARNRCHGPRVETL